MSDKKLKVFQVTAVDWWAGYDADSVREAYRKNVGPEADTFFQEFGEPHEVSEEALDRLTVTDVDEEGQPKHTFREVLNEIRERGRSVPCFVATSEW